MVLKKVRRKKVKIDLGIHFFKIQKPRGGFMVFGFFSKNMNPPLGKFFFSIILKKCPVLENQGKKIS